MTKASASAGSTAGPDLVPGVIPVLGQLDDLAGLVARKSHLLLGPRQTGRVVGLDRDRAQRRRPVRRLELARRNAPQEPRQRLVLSHADAGIVIASHADISDVGCAPGQDAQVRRRHMRMRADYEACSTVAEITHRLLFARRFAVKI